jgi:hypothetical protein
MVSWKGALFLGRGRTAHGRSVCVCWLVRPGRAGAGGVGDRPGQGQVVAARADRGGRRATRTRCRASSRGINASRKRGETGQRRPSLGAPPTLAGLAYDGRPQHGRDWKPSSALASRIHRTARSAKSSPTMNETS